MLHISRSAEVEGREVLQIEAEQSSILREGPSDCDGLELGQVAQGCKVAPLSGM